MVAQLLSVRPHSTMKAFVKILATVIDRLIWSVGCFTIIIYSHNHWPEVYDVIATSFLIGFGVWYFWRFFFKPFRAGLRGE